MSALLHQPAHASHKERRQDALLVGLRLAGWLATSVMATLGVATLFFWLLGNFTLPGTMLQLDNLASRYLEADAARRAQFHTIICTVLGLSFALIAFFRRASLRAAFDVTGGDDD
ncbi:MAG: hypothetical protein AAFR32_05290 [Pseudomonadota bacterium]